MSGKLIWNPGPALQTIGARVASRLEFIAEDIAADAVARAPIRKAFSGRSRKGARHAQNVTSMKDFRMKLGNGQVLTGKDLKDAMADLGLNPEQIHIASGGGVQRMRGRGYMGSGRGSGFNNVNSARGIAMRREIVPIRTGTPEGGVRISGYHIKKSGTPGKPGLNRLITNRARYDVTRGRGVISKGKGVYQYGGFLRKNIKAVMVSEDLDGLIQWRIVSAAPYSKYVEFPTSRTAAQPFLLPAFKAWSVEKYRGALTKAIKG